MDMHLILEVLQAAVLVTVIVRNVLELAGEVAAMWREHRHRNG